MFYVDPWKIKESTPLSREKIKLFWSGKLNKDLIKIVGLD